MDPIIISGVGAGDLVWFVFVDVSNTLNALEGKLPVVVSFSVSVYEFNILLTERVNSFTCAVSETQTHTYKHKQNLPNTFHFPHIT